MWTLIIIMHVGMLGKTDSNSITTAVFPSQVACERAGKQSKELVKGTTKVIEYTCAQH